MATYQNTLYFRAHSGSPGFAKTQATFTIDRSMPLRAQITDLISQRERGAGLHGEKKTLYMVASGQGELATYNPGLTHFGELLRDTAQRTGPSVMMDFTAPKGLYGNPDNALAPWFLGRSLLEVNAANLFANTTVSRVQVLTGQKNMAAPSMFFQGTAISKGIGSFAQTLAELSLLSSKTNNTVIWWPSNVYASPTAIRELINASGKSRKPFTLMAAHLPMLERDSWPSGFVKGAVEDNCIIAPGRNYDGNHPLSVLGPIAIKPEAFGRFVPTTDGKTKIGIADPALNWDTNPGYDPLYALLSTVANLGMVDTAEVSNTDVFRTRTPMDLLRLASKLNLGFGNFAEEGVGMVPFGPDVWTVDGFKRTFVHAPNKETAGQLIKGADFRNDPQVINKSGVPSTYGDVVKAALAAAGRKKLTDQDRASLLREVPIIILGRGNARETVTANIHNMGFRTVLSEEITPFQMKDPNAAFNINDPKKSVTFSDSAAPSIEWFLRPDVLFGDLYPHMINQIWWGNTTITPIVIMAFDPKETSLNQNSSRIYEAAQMALKDVFGKPNAPIFIASTDNSQITALATRNGEKQMRVGPKALGGVAREGLPIAMDALFLEALGSNAYWLR